MGIPEWTVVGCFIFGLIATAFGYLLSSRYSKQEETAKENKKEADELFKDLYKKNQENITKISQLELEIAKNHFDKTEISSMFATAKTYLDEKFSELRDSIESSKDRRHP